VASSLRRNPFIGIPNGIIVEKIPQDRKEAKQSVWIKQGEKL